MIKRKITRRLEQMLEDGGKYALLIDGARQVGKTFIVLGGNPALNSKPA